MSKRRKGTGRIDTGQCILDTKGLDVRGESLLKVRDGFLFGVPLSIGRDVGNAGREAALLHVGDELHREALHAAIVARRLDPNLS